MIGYLFTTAFSALDKTIFIESSSATYFNDSFGRTQFVAHFAKYYLRSLIKPLLEPYLGSTKAAIISGSIGGSIGYGLRDLNILAGIINNVGYELCNDKKACANSKVNNFYITTALEGLDPFFKFTFKSLYESGLIATTTNLANNLNYLTVFSAIKDGAISAIIMEMLYTPNEGFSSNMYNCFHNLDFYCASTTIQNAAIATVKYPFELLSGIIEVDIFGDEL